MAIRKPRTITAKTYPLIDYDVEKGKVWIQLAPHGRVMYLAQGKASVFADRAYRVVRYAKKAKRLR